MYKHHTVKSVNPWFQLHWDNLKFIELRLNDRDYKIGDTLIQREYDADTDSYSGRATTARIVDIQSFEGLKDGWVILILHPDIWRYHNFNPDQIRNYNT